MHVTSRTCPAARLGDDGARPGRAMLANRLLYGSSIICLLLGLAVKG